jgi:hypothetical protein
MEEKELVTSLIADHLRHMRLLSGLERLGFDVLIYYIGTPELVLKIMGLTESETIFLFYITAIDLKCKSKKYKENAEQLYEDLVMMREEFLSTSKN